MVEMKRFYNEQSLRTKVAFTVSMLCQCTDVFRVQVLYLIEEDESHRPIRDSALVRDAMLSKKTTWRRI